MKTFLLIAEHRRGELRPISLEVIAAAQELRQADDKVVVAVIGEQAENYVGDLSVAGVDEIITVKTASVEFDPDIFEACNHFADGKAGSGSCSATA